MVKLKRLKINKYRNVRPGTELRFDDGYNLVLGQNGSGKTTLLGLISLVASNDFSSLLDEAFALEYELANEDHKLLVTLESAGRSDLPDVDVGPPPPVNYRYQAKCLDVTSSILFEIEGTPKHTTTKHLSESEEGPAESPFRRGFLVGAPVTYLNESLFRILLSLYSDPVARFDESLDCFHALTGRVPPTPGVATPPVSRFLVSQIGNRSAHTRLVQFASRNLGLALFATPEQPGGEIHLDLASGQPCPPELEFLRAASQNMGSLATSCRPASKTLSETGATLRNVLLEIKGLAFTFKRANGVTLEHDLLSYGQKRLLAFFYYLTVNSDIAIADELVNGLHHRWIQACMEAIGDRQAFLTSQNPLLFDYVPEFESVEQVQSRFITCKIEIVDGAEQLVWQNMSHDDAVKFFRGYEAEIEGVGDVLINRGLW